MKLILVAGSWGSGTTAVIGVLDKIGVATIGPYLQSNDIRTENTFELISFRNLILTYVDEESISHKANYDYEFIPALKKYKTVLEKMGEEVIALKMPLASVCLPEICQVFETKIILVHRPFTEIEASRVRRRWYPLFGQIGATKIYTKVFNDMIQSKLTCLSVSYDDIVNKTDETLSQIIKYCEVEYLAQNLEKVNEFIVGR